ncbi:MAG: ribonuclease P protein component [Clostridia bacterium]|nr:ribonuclease P protein component [Clostridia bacterium]
MQKVYRLTQRRSFSYIYKKGATCATPRIVLYTVDARSLKVGVVVGKKVGNSVVRSRVKRRISERFRLLIPSVDEKKNFIVVARSACADATSAQINDDLVYLLKKSGALKEQ